MGASVAVGARSALPLVEHHSGAPVSCLSRCSLCVVHSGAKLDIDGAGVSVLSTNHFGTPWAVIVLAVLDFFVSGHCHFRTSMYIVLDVPIKRLVIARSLEMCISLLCQNGAPVRDAFQHVEPPRGITTDTWYWQELAVVLLTARPCAGIGKSLLTSLCNERISEQQCRMEIATSKSPSCCGDPCCLEFNKKYF